MPAEERYCANCRDRLWAGESTCRACGVYADLAAKADAELAKLKEVWEKDVPALNKLVKESDVPAIK